MIYAKGRVKWTKKPLPSLLEQQLLCPFDERSDSGKPKVFGSSARRHLTYDTMHVLYAECVHIKE